MWRLIREMDGKVAKPGILVARIAERQHGVVSIGQLRLCGVSDDAVTAKAALGQLHRVHRGVYALGHRALSPEGRWMATVLALGGGPGDGGSVLEHWGAAVSHRSALSLWSLLPADRAPCDVIVAGNGGRARRTGIRVHRSLTLVKQLVVETDSYLYHRGEVAFQDDHARDLGLMRRGFEVLRLSELQLDEEPAQVAEVLAARLAAAGDAV